VAGESTSASAYHDATKHHFHRYARSLGYLDWATQPDPFRRFAGAPLIELPRPAAAPDTPYSALYGGAVPPAAVSLASIGTLLRYSLGLSAWKQHGASRWALRVNPSSGNLHPTEGYIIWDSGLFHYAPKAHALERRADLVAARPGLIVGLTSIHWREAWKYGERAFRYCQHDAGHAIAALRLSARMLGWTLRLLPVTDAVVATLLGIDRDEDFADAEREDAECLLWAGPEDDQPPDVAGLIDAARAGVWHGRANQLSADRVEWPLIDAVAQATRREEAPSDPRTSGPSAPLPPGLPDLSAAGIILQRRSALGFDPRGHLRRDAFARMLARLRPGAPPWDAVGWPPHVHLALFVHRVQEITPGIYAYARSPDAVPDLTRQMRGEFLWEPVDGVEGLFLLAPVDTRATANRLSCNQDIAEDGFFSLGMLARFEAPLRSEGEWFYRRLFWEAGMIGQVLYLEAEAAGARATGIGCFFDDPVHALLGLSGHAWQSLYHFSMGLPLDDERLTTEAGYEWESVGSS
jgi:SagB-type dehydrogenase family enzyme